MITENILDSLTIVETPKDISSSQNKKKGLILGHGHNYKPPIIPKFITEEVEWKMVDIDPDTCPDYIANLFVKDDLIKIGLFNWDYILEYNLPIRSNIHGIECLLRSCRWLLTSGGILIANVIDTFSRDLYGQKEIFALGMKLSRAEMKSNASSSLYFRGELPLIDSTLVRLVNKEQYLSYEILPRHIIFTA